MNKGFIKIISLVGMALGLVGTVVSDFANSKEQDLIIEEKINKKFDEMKSND